MTAYSNNHEYKVLFKIWLFPEVIIFAPATDGASGIFSEIGGKGQ
jgi:hypothetical protein